MFYSGVFYRKRRHWHEKFKINHFITDTAELFSSQLKTTALIFTYVPHFPLFEYLYKFH